jgi:hypothetical protein
MFNVEGYTNVKKARLYMVLKTCYRGSEKGNHRRRVNEGTVLSETPDRDRSHAPFTSNSQSSIVGPESPYQSSIARIQQFERRNSAMFLPISLAQGIHSFPMPLICPLGRVTISLAKDFFQVLCKSNTKIHSSFLFNLNPAVN